MFNTKSSIPAHKLLTKEILMFKHLPHREPKDYIIVLKEDINKLNESLEQKLNKESELNNFKIFYPDTRTNQHHDLEHYINEKLLLNKDCKINFVIEGFDSNDLKNKVYSVKMNAETTKDRINIEFEDIIKYLD